MAERAAGRRMFVALQHREFRWFWLSRLCADTGLWFQTTAQAWLVYELTGSPFHLGLVGAFRAVPQIALALIGGTIADRMRKRAFIQATQSTNMLLILALATLTLLGWIEVWQVYALTFLMGLVSALDGPARQAIIGELVPQEHIPNAVALNGASHNGTRIIGPGLSGLTIALWGTAYSFYINAALIGLGVLALARIPAGEAGRAARQQPLERALKEVFRYVWANPRLSGFLGIVAAVNFFGGSVTAVLAIFAAEVIGPGPLGLGPGPHLLGLLSGASAFGAFTGSLAVAGWLSQRRDQERLAVLGAVGLGLLLMLFANSTWAIASLVIMFCFGTTFTSVSTLINGLIQMSVREDVRGRVMSLYWAATVGMMPLGGIWAGSLGSLLTVPLAVALSGAAVALLVLVIAWRTPVLARQPLGFSAGASHPS